MNRIQNTALCLVLMIGLALIVSAEVPHQMNYQGRLTDAQGSLIDTTVDLTITIFDDESGTTSLWSETSPDVSVTDGLFSIILGSTNPITGSVLNGQIRWLGIQVESGSVMLPLTPIVSSAYAIHSSFADTADYALSSSGGSGGWIDDGTVVRLSTLNDSVGIGTTTPSSKLDVVGDMVIIGKTTIGDDNTNTGTFSTISGGTHHDALGDYAVVSGGAYNNAEENYSTVAGGDHNYATEEYATTGGGRDNRTKNQFATISGGNYNHASGIGSFIGGGSTNRASGDYSVISGGGGSEFSDSNSAQGEFSTVGGGKKNIASKFGATVSGGKSNKALQYYSTIAGGQSNIVEGQSSTIGGGFGNYTYGFATTVGGGSSNIAWFDFSTVGGGHHNTARGAYSVVGGGGGEYADSNYAHGSYSVVPGGKGNGAIGDYSFAAGLRAKANHSGTFVWADNINEDFVSTGSSQFLIRANGGVGIGVTSPDGLLEITDNSDGVALHFSDADRDITWTSGQSLQFGDWDGATFNQRMRIHADGNVGVNTTSPNGQLHVRSNSDGIALHLSNASGDLTWPADNTLNMGTWDGATFVEHMRITAGGNVGIGGVTSTPNILTVIRYSATDPVADSWGTWSSRRWKENIQPLEHALDKIQRLEGVSFDWKGNGQSDIGLIAEEVAKIVPEVVAFEENGIDAQSVDYARLVSVLIEAVKEQQEIIQQQDKSIEELSFKIEAIQTALKSFGVESTTISEGK